MEVSILHVTDRLTLDALSLGKGSRLLLSGANGSGGSTLLQVLAGRLCPNAGSVTVTGRVGLLEQDTRFADPSATAREVDALAVGAWRAEEISLRALGLLPPASHGTPVGALSTGQQRRLALATLPANPPRPAPAGRTDKSPVAHARHGIGGGDGDLCGQGAGRQPRPMASPTVER